MPQIKTTTVAESFTIPIGPQHPALKEPGHFAIDVAGEVVQSARVRLGYAHRGIEKATEGRSWTQNIYLLERVCGICSHIHATAYCLGVEALAEVEVPPRAQAIRTLTAELERIHSHLLWLGVAAHEAGFDTLFMYSWRDRETVMDMLEGLSGNRVNYSINVLGGVKYDISKALTRRMIEGFDVLAQRTAGYLDLAHGDPMFRQRTVGVGTMSKAQAETWGVVGPTARASGVTRDIRADAPYAGYDLFPIRLVVDEAGDLAARVVVRLIETIESIRLCREILENMPDSPLEVKRMPRKIKAGETVSRVEAPRGELFYFIRSEGGDKPARIKVRTPTICNMGSVIHLVVGHQLADVPMILAGIDPCFSCNDRGVRVTAAGDVDFWTWNRLRRFGIDHYQRLLEASS